MRLEMLIILLLLAGLPLLGLESLRWSRQQDNQRAGRKAVLLAASTSVFWALLGDHIGTVYFGWRWVSIVLLCAGAYYISHCVRRCFKEADGKRPIVRTVLIYAAVFLFVTWVIPDWLWMKLHENIGAASALSRYRGPLH